MIYQMRFTFNNKTIVNYLKSQKKINVTPETGRIRLTCAEIFFYFNQRISWLDSGEQVATSSPYMTSYMLWVFQVDGRSGIRTSMLPVASTNCNLPEEGEIWIEGILMMIRSTEVYNPTHLNFTVHNQHFENLTPSENHVKCAEHTIQMLKKIDRKSVV